MLRMLRQINRLLTVLECPSRMASRVGAPTDLFFHPERCFGQVFGTYGRPSRSLTDCFPDLAVLMRSISPWLLPSCLSLGWKPTPGGEGLVHFRSRVSMTGWLAATTAAPANDVTGDIARLALTRLSPPHPCQDAPHFFGRN